MPVRARSRRSSSSRNSSVLVAMRAQLVEFGIVAGGDHIAFAQEVRRFAAMAASSIAARGVIGRRVAQRASSGESQAASAARSGGQGRQRVAQLREVARPRAAQRDTREDAFHIADAREAAAHGVEAAPSPARRPHPSAARSSGAVTQRAVQPAAQQRARPSRWRRCRARASSVAARRCREARVELEVAPCRRIERSALAALLHLQRADVGSGGLLRVAHVLQQRAGRADAERQPSAPKPPGRACRTARSAGARRSRARNARAARRRCAAADARQRLAAAALRRAAVPPAAGARARRRASRPPSSRTVKRPAARSSQARPKRARRRAASAASSGVARAPRAARRR